MRLLYGGPDVRVPCTTGRFGFFAEPVAGRCPGPGSISASGRSVPSAVRTLPSAPSDSQGRAALGESV